MIEYVSEELETLFAKVEELEDSVEWLSEKVDMFIEEVYIIKAMMRDRESAFHYVDDDIDELPAKNPFRFAEDDELPDEDEGNR